MNEGLKVALNVIKNEAEKRNWRKVTSIINSFNSFQERVYGENGLYIYRGVDDNPGYAEADLLDYELNFIDTVYSIEI